MPKFVCKFFLFLTLLAIYGCFGDGVAQRWVIAPEAVTSASLSRNGHFALYASSTDGIVLWDLKENKKLADLGHQDPVKSTVIASKISDNRRYAITATSQNFAVWDLAWAQAKGLWAISDGAIRDVDISDSGDMVLLGLSNGKALFIDLGTGRRLEFLAHQEKVNSVSLSPNGKYALSGGNDRNAYFWSTESGQILNQFPHQYRLSRVELQRDGHYAFTADADQKAVIWKLPSGEQQSKLDLYQRQNNFSAARFSDDGKLLATGTPSRQVAVWDTQTGKNIDHHVAEIQQNTRPPNAIVYDVAISLDQRVIAASSAGIVEAWVIDP